MNNKPQITKVTFDNQTKFVEHEYYRNLYTRIQQIFDQRNESQTAKNENWEIQITPIHSIEIHNKEELKINNIDVNSSYYNLNQKINAEDILETEKLHEQVFPTLIIAIKYDQDHRNPRYIQPPQILMPSPKSESY